jgi:hypothetical protein
MTGNYDSATGNYIGQRLSGTSIASTGLVALAGFADSQMVYIGHAAYASDGKYCIFNQLSDMTIDDDNVPNGTTYSGVATYGTWNNEIRNIRFGNLATPFTHWDLNLGQGTYTTSLYNVQGSTLQIASPVTGDLTTISGYSTSWTFINILGANGVDFYATTIQGNAGAYNDHRVQISNSNNVKFDGGDLEGTGTYFTISGCKGVKITDNNVAMNGTYTNGGPQTSVFFNILNSSQIVSRDNVFMNWSPPGTYFVDGGGNSLLELYDLSGAFFVGARSHASSTQALSSGAFTIINFDVTDFDTDAGITTGAAWKYKVPNAGKYQVCAQTVVNGGAGDTIYVAIFKNGVEIKRGGPPDTDIALGITFVPVNDIVSCAAGDYIDIRVFDSNATPVLQSSITGNTVTITREYGS